jgi:diguanylate cyclase (GGDEF)-like protein
MKVIRRQSPVDLLGAVSVACMVALVGILCYVAAGDPRSRQMLAILVTGLSAGGLILFRQLRKAANGLITSEARAQYAATHDHLTQLPNKALLIDRLRGLAQGGGGAGAPIRILCVAMDRYDEVGEVLGPDAADEVILEIAGRLGSICRETDLLARLGDDLFALVLSGAVDAKTRDGVGGMIELLSAPYQAASGQAVITCSIGTSLPARGAADPIETLRQAQIALSSAKRRGAAQFGVFDPSMDHAIKGRKSLEVDLRRALAERALTMVYQPQVNAKGALVGVEALMRWTSPVRGLIAASTFVPLAETCGLSDALGRFALQQAFEDARHWPGLKVAINVSAPHVRSGGLVATLKTLLAETGADARDFELEITESVLLADEPETYDTLHAVRKLGFSLALDDFGTGYSSLSYLRRFPVDKIKIDRSFVSHLGKRPESTAIIQAIVDMADALDLKVLAEGVESLDQVHRLINIGCIHFQGYYYSEPVEARIIGDLLAGRARLAA